MNETKTKPYHVLVVEDEEHLAHGIKFNLDAEGYRVTAIRDGRVAMDLIEENAGAFDLIVLDIMLPGVSGYEICQRVRQNDRETPILILSARTLREDQARAFDVGANQYMTKPFDLEEFLSRVNNLLTFQPRRKVPAGAASYVFGQSEVNFETFQAKVRGTPVSLTQLEMRLLRYFIDHAGRAISRQELLENVWNMSGDVQTRAPDQFLRRLRKIFEEDPAHPRHFVTLRDVGYRFMPEGEPVEEVQQ